MTPIPTLSVARAATAIGADLLASASVRVTMDMLPGLRRRPGPGIGESIARRVMELRENGVARQAPERRYQHRLHPPLLSASAFSYGDARQHLVSQKVERSTA